MPSYYSVKRDGEKVVVTTANNEAMENFFGWGSGSDPVDAQFYGNRVRTIGARGAEWRWALTDAAVGRMIGYIRDHIDDQSYYEKKMVPSARELLKKLEAVK